MSTISSPLKKTLLLLTWLSFLLQLSWANSDCDISIAFHPSHSDTLKTVDKWIAWDKIEHTGVSALFSGVFYSIFRDFYNNNRESSTYFSATLTFSLGLGKEFYDKRSPKGRFSFKDLVADILGMGLGLWIATR
jgi:uncharacterized protein YfiM (DUF2279 family)